MPTYRDHHHHEDPSEDQAIADLPPDERDDEQRGVGIGAWGLSIVIHSIALLALLAVVFVQPFQDQAPVQVAFVPPPLEEPPEEVERDFEEVDSVVIPVPEALEDASVEMLEIPVDEIETTEDPDPTDASASGDPSKVASIETGSTGAFMAIGISSGGSGKAGLQGRGERRRTRGGPHGPTRATESAVEAALRWFRDHQAPNGMWDVDGYPAYCDAAAPRCEPGTAHTDAGGDAACSAYALLCFLGAGYDHHHPSKYRKVMQDGLDWLLSVQQPDGAFPGRNYTHGVATLALVEALAMTNDPALREPAQRAVDVLLARQLIDGEGYPLAWNYREPQAERIDSSVSGWCVMALKGARAAGLDTGQGLAGSKRWLRSAWEAANPDHSAIVGGSDETAESGFPYTWNPQTGEVKGAPSRASIGGLCAVFLDGRLGDPMLESLANYVSAHQLPDAYPTNTYYLYYNTLFVFMMGGPRFEAWNDRVADLLVDAQRRDGCFDGSWDFAGTRFHGHDTGRLLSTAYCCLSLEVYYRYQPLQQRDARHQREIELVP